MGDPRGPVPARRVRGVFHALAVVAMAALVGCTSQSSAPAVESAGGLERRVVQITTRAGDTVEIEAELADTEQARAVGLMGRDSLAPDSGMVLLHDEPGIIRLWMKDTTIPLSAAWFDESGRIVWIDDLEPCESDPCPRYAPQVPVIGALEVNRGAFDRYGVSIGDTLELEPPAP